MPFDDLAKDRGDKVDLHLHLREPRVAVLDALCRKYECSRSAAVEALIDEYAENVSERLKGKTT